MLLNTVQALVDVVQAAVHAGEAFAHLEQWAPEWWARVTGGAMGSMAGFAGSAAGTGAVIDRLTRLAGITGRAARAANAAGMLTAGSALETISQAGLDAAEAARSGKSPEEAAEIARKSAMLAAGPTVLFNALGLYDPRHASTIKRFLWDAAMEVAQENSQQIASNYASGRPLDEGLLESTIGAGAAVLIGEPILRGAHARARRRAEESARLAAEQRAQAQTPTPAGSVPSATAAPGQEQLDQVLDYLRRARRPVTRQEIVNELGIGPRQVGQILDALHERGDVELTERDRWRYYSVRGELPLQPGQPATGEPAATPPDPLSEYKARALEIARREGRIRRWGIQNALNVDRTTASRILSELIQDGQLDSEGKYIGGAREAPAQQIAIGAQDESEYDAPEPQAIPAERRGQVEEVATPLGTTAQAQWVLLDLASPEAPLVSHDPAGNPNPAYPQQYQGRQRARIASRAQIEELARRFDPELAGPNRLSNQGAPIDVVLPDGRQVTISGNGRTLAQAVMYQLHPQRAEAYREYLARVLPELGIDPKALEGMQMPSLRRVLTGKVRLGRFAEESNTETVARRSAAEIAASDAKKLTPDLLSTFRPSETGEIGTPDNAEFMRQFFEAVIPPAERGAYMTPDGALSQEGERRLRNAIFAAAYGDASIVERMAESRDDASRRTTEGMLRAAPDIAQMESDIRAGALHPLGAAGDIAAAARKLAYLRQRGQTAADYLAQQPMFGRELSAEAEAWLRVFDQHGRAPRRVADILRAYAAQVCALGHPQQAALFGGEGKLPAKRDLIAGAVEQATGEEATLSPAALEREPLYAEALALVRKLGEGKIPSVYTNKLQHHLRIPHERAARLLDMMRERGEFFTGDVAPPPAGPAATSVRPARGESTPRRELPPFITRPPAIRQPQHGLRPRGDFAISGGAIFALPSAEGYVVLAARPRASLKREERDDAITGYLADYHLDDVTGGNEWRAELARRSLTPDNLVGYARLSVGPEFGPIEGRTPPPEELVPLHVAVVPSFRGQGVANALYDAAEQAHRATTGQPARVIPAPAQTEGARRLWQRRRAGQAAAEAERPASYPLIQQSLFEPAPAGPPAEPEPVGLRRPQRPFAQALEQHARWEKQLQRLLSAPGSSEEDIRLAARMVDKYAAMIAPEVRSGGPITAFEVADTLGERMLAAAAAVERGSQNWEQRRAGLERIAARIRRLFASEYPVPPLAGPVETRLKPAAGETAPRREPVETPAVTPATAKTLDDYLAAVAQAEASASTDQHQAARKQLELVSRIRQAIGAGEDIRLRLERIAEEVYGATRASGAFEMRDLYEAQEAAVHGWLRDNARRLIEMPFAEASAEIRSVLGRLATETVRNQQQIDLQQFSTPPTVALLVAKLADPQPGDVLLEPSAGVGGLAALLEPLVAETHLNEIDPQRAALAEAIGLPKATAHNAEALNALLEPEIQPTLIVMNPPFTRAAGGALRALRYGFLHLDQALQRLEPGGRLVALLTGGRRGFEDVEGAGLKAPGARAYWERTADKYHIRANVRLSGKEYAKYGTSMPVQLIVIDKTGPTPGRTSTERLANVQTGKYNTVEEAYDALRAIDREVQRLSDRGPVAQPESEKSPGRQAARGSVDGTEREVVGGDREPLGGDEAVAGGVRSGGNVAGHPDDLHLIGPQLADRGGRPERRPPDQRPGAAQPESGPKQSTQAPPARGGESAPGLAQAGVARLPGAGGRGGLDLASASGLSPDQIIDAATNALASLLGQTPAAPQTAPEAAPQTPPFVTEPPPIRTTPPPSAPEENPSAKLEQAAQQAAARLRAKIRGQQLQSGIDPQDLIDLATIGANYMVKGVTRFANWSERMIADAGDILKHFAAETKRTVESILREVHAYAAQVARRFGATDIEAPPAEAEAAEGRWVRIVPAPLTGGPPADAGAFVLYQPSIQGSPHKGVLVETQTMASVRTPPLTYQPHLPQELLDSGDLSAAQMEAIVLAGQANETILPNGARAAALIGDGTGVGKGRIIAGIALDHWNQGRRRIVWVTDNWRLLEDAKRDLNGIGASYLARTITRADKFPYGAKINHGGVLFAPYSWLRSADRKQRKRINQLIDYVRGDDDGEGAVVVFDESHNLKNATGVGRQQPSDTGMAVSELLQKVPKLRTAFLSATAATELHNMGYLSRLGLWGPKTPFPGGFGEFQTQLGRGGMSAMELLARELKARGRYIARTISFRGVILREDAVHPLNPGQKAIYRSAARAWRLVMGMLDQAIETTNATGSSVKGEFMQEFWGAQQRFFNLLLTAMKIPTAVEQARKALDEGYSVVISLINTNEATQKREEQRAKERTAKLEEGQEVPEDDNFDFGPKSILIDLIENRFPVEQWVDDVDEEGKPIKQPLVDENGKRVLNPEAVRMRDELVARLSRELALPQNPLDMLIEALGGRSQVAELTGRQKIYDEATGKFVPRGEPGMPRNQVNIVEAEKFQNGEKRVAIISNAASTGISLHADNTKKSRQKRLQITLQVGWSADKAMQMLGRTHRTNQAHPPEYLMVVSDLGGEKRFISTIAKRLGSLGALTRGSREAAGATSDAISKVNFDSTEGRRAANAFYDHLLRNPVVVHGVNPAEFVGKTGLRVSFPGGEGTLVSPLHNAEDYLLTVRTDSGEEVEVLRRDVRIEGEEVTGHEILRQMGVLHVSERTGEVSVTPGDRDSVNRLLNRLLALDPDIQNAAYDLYYDFFEQAVARALEDGTLDLGVRQLHGERPKILEKNILATDKTTGAETIHYVVETQVRQQRTSPDELEQLSRRHKEGRLYHVKTQDGDSVAFAWPAPDVVHASGVVEKAVYVVRPDRGRQKMADSRFKGVPLAQYIEQRQTELKDLIKRRQEDIEFYKNLGGHYAKEAQTRRAELEGLRRELAELSGISDPEAEGRRRWQEIFEATPEFAPERHDLLGGTVLQWWGHIQDAGVQGIFAVQDTDTGERIVGVEVAKGNLKKLIEHISGGVVTATPRQVMTDVVENGTRYDLAHGVALVRGKVGRRPVVQVHHGGYERRLRALGVQYEAGVVPIMYIPNSDQGLETLRKVLDEFPIAPSKRSGESGAVTLDFLLFGAELIHKGIVKFAEWSKRMLERFGEAVRRDLVRLYYQAKAVARNIFSDERGSLSDRELGPHGPIFREFYHDAKGAIAKLRELKTGEAVAALHHPEIGDIDLVWGRPGTPENNYDDGYGLAHIIEKHERRQREEVLDSLQEILERLPVRSKSPNRIQLWDDQHRAAVRLDWDGEAKRWLLTMFKKPSTPGRTTGVSEAPLSERGGTPPPVAASSIIGRKTAFEKSPEYQAAVARGAQLLREGVTRFADWSRRMLAEFGERIKPYLTRLYFEAKRFWRDTSGQSEIEVRAINALTEHARNLARGVRTRVGQRGRRSAIVDLLDIVFMPLESRLAREGGGAGRPLAEALKRAGDWGEVSAGQRLLRLSDSGLAQLTREQRWNLLDVLEGRDDAMDDDVNRAYQVIRELTDGIAAEAEDLEVEIRRSDGSRLPFAAIADYYPHVMRNTDALRSGPVRNDILANLVRLGIQPSQREAEAFLDEYIAFVDSGARGERLLAYMVTTGQAATREEAWQKLRRSRAHVHRHGSLEYAREVNLPFYDPDPLRVLPTHVASESIRLAQIAEFGQDNQVIARQIRRIAEAGGNADWVQKAVDRITGYATQADSMAERVSRMLRALQGFKLYLAAIPNSTQGVMNSLLAADLPAVAIGLRAALGQRGKRLAVESGATIDPVLHESVRELSGSSRALEHFLRAVGFTATERFNRVVAANVGAAYAQRMLDKLRANPGHKRARRLLLELGIDPEAALQRGHLTGDDVLMAAKRFSDMTQFRSRAQDHPEWASTPWGKVIFQFKTFPYGQTKLLYRHLVDEARRGEFGRAFRNLLVLAVLYPLPGEVIIAIRNLLTGREREAEGLRRWLENAAAVGSLGIAWEILESAERRRALAFLGGSSASLVGDVVELVPQADDPEAWKRFAYRHAPFGAVARRAIEGPP